MQDLFAPSQTMVGPSVAPDMPDAISIGRARTENVKCKVGAPGDFFLFGDQTHERDYWGVGSFLNFMSSRSWEKGPMYKSTSEKQSKMGKDYSSGTGSWELDFFLSREFVRLSHMI